MNSSGSDYSARIADREALVWEYVSNSSPVLIWQGEKGISVIAPTRPEAERRLHTILERFACASRGTDAGGRILAAQAAATGWNLAPEWTRAHVPASRIVDDVCALIQDRLYQISSAPIAAEAVLVEVGAEMSLDFLCRISYRGEAKRFSKALLLGTVAEDSSDGVEHDEDELSDRLQQELLDSWHADASDDDMHRIVQDLPVFQEHPTMAKQFTGSREILFLDRDAVLKARPYEVIQRIDSYRGK